MTGTRDGRTERCELVSGVCRLTGGVEELEGSGHVSAWLSAEEDARRAERRIAEFRATDGTAQSHHGEHRFDPCQLERRKHG